MITVCSEFMAPYIYSLVASSFALVCRPRFYAPIALRLLRCILRYVTHFLYGRCEHSLHRLKARVVKSYLAYSACVRKSFGVFFDSSVFLVNFLSRGPRGHTRENPTHFPCFYNLFISILYKQASKEKNRKRKKKRAVNSDLFHTVGISDFSKDNS